MQRSAEDTPVARTSVGVVVPAFNAEATLSQCVEAIMAMSIPADDIVIVDDASTDRTAAIATTFGVRVLTIAFPSRGPAYARNLGTAAIATDFAMFVDSDVIVHPDALGKLLDDVQHHGAAGAFGSYDDQPKSQRATSLYANLRHHYVHQHGSRNASSFWSGLGLIDRRVFLDVGGFDGQRYPHPSIEDVELGARLIRLGFRLRLVPEAQGTHCKDWRLSNVWWTDIARRAYPWSQLIAEGIGPRIDLNLTTTERIKAMFAVFALIGIATGPIWPPAWYVGALSASAYFALNLHFFAYLAHRIRPSALFVAISMHWVYHLYAVAVFAATLAWVSIKRQLGKEDGNRDPRT